MHAVLLGLTNIVRVVCSIHPSDGASQVRQARNIMQFWMLELHAPLLASPLNAELPELPSSGLLSTTLQ